MSLIAGWAVLTLFAQVRHSEPQIPVRPTLEEEGSFSMILIPDPQSQIKFAANQPLFELMTAWVAQNIDRLRIRAALFTGDMVEQNDQLTGGDPCALPQRRPDVAAAMECRFTGLGTAGRPDSLYRLSRESRRGLRCGGKSPFDDAAVHLSRTQYRDRRASGRCRPQSRKCSYAGECRL